MNLHVYTYSVLADAKRKLEESFRKSTEYAGLGLQQLEGAVAQLQARLEEAQREHRHAQIEKVDL